MDVARRRLRPEARRREILDTAKRLLKARGPDVRVEDVTREAGAAKGTFYLYFPSWDDLLDVIRAELFAEFDKVHPLPSRPEEASDWPNALDSLAVEFVAATLEMSGLHDAIFHSDFARRRPMAPDFHPVGRLVAFIRAGQKAGALADVDVEPTARLLFAVIHETVDAVAEGGDRGRSLTAMRRVLRRVLAPASPEG
jgi:AcrR family transcriptional regulator